MKYFWKVAALALIISAIQLLLGIIRPIVGIEVSISLAFILFFSLVYVISKSQRLISPNYVTLIILGILLLIHVPTRVTSFYGTSHTFIEFIFELLGLFVGWLHLKTGATRKGWVLSALAFLILIGPGIRMNNIINNVRLYGNYSQDVLEQNPAELIGKDIHGVNVSIKDLQGKIIVLDFWHTRCAVCFQQFPKFQRLYDAYKDNHHVIILAVNHPLKSDTTNQAFEMLLQQNYSFPTIIAKNREIAPNLGVHYYPTYLIFDPDGNLVYRGNLEGIQKRIDALLR